MKIALIVISLIVGGLLVVPWLMRFLEWYYKIVDAWWDRWDNR